MKRVLLTLAVLFCAAFFNQTFAQPGNMEGDVISGSWNNTQTLTDLGTFRQYRGQRTGASGNGNFLFNPSPGNYGTQWTGSNAPNFVRSLNTYHNGGAFYYTGGGWNTDLQIATTNGNYYTFNFLENGAANSSIEILETTYNPVTLSGLTRTAGNYGTHVFTVTASSAPSAGENVFLRFSTNGYTNSTLVQFTFVGTTGTATVPAQAPNATLVAYAYSSNKSQASIESDVTGNGQSAHDLATLNLSNGVSYSVPNNPVIVTSSAGSAAGVATGYATMQAAFTAINGGAVHLGVITIGLIGNTTETASAVLNQVAGVTSIGIQPAGGAARSISGAIAAGSPIIDFNGADNVTVDGLNSGGNSLTISNTTVSNTASTSTIRFIADATNNTVQNCTISGSSTVANSVSVLGGTIIFSTGTTTGNDGNKINNNTITSAGANFASCAIASVGTSAGVDNSGIQITNNNIQDYFSAANNSFGILAGNNNSTWTISGNRFFQSATRTATSGSTHVGMRIQSGNGYVITNNVIGFANSGGTGTTSYAGSVANRFIGIDLAVGTTVTSSVQGNTISGINLNTSSGASNNNGIFTAIYVTAGNVNIGTSTGNTIGNSAATNFIFITTTTSGALINGISSSSTGTVNIQNNSISSFGFGGTAAIGYVLNAIVTSGTAGVYTISSNTIGSTTTANSIAVGVSGTTTTACTFYGVRNSATGATSITNNTIQNCTIYGTGAHVLRGIENTGASATLAITGNTLLAFSMPASTTGTFTAISNSGSVTTSINLNSNFLGNASFGLITLGAANSGAVTGISNSAGATGTTLNINSNDIRGITNSVASSGAHTYIINSTFTGNSNINSNTFTNLNVNTTNSVTFISNDVTHAASTTHQCNNNSIVTGFNKGGSGGTVRFFYANGTSGSTVSLTQTGNNFSNVTVTGTTVVEGWRESDGGSPTKTVSNNTFTNITGGSGSVGVLNVSYSSAGTVSGNTITNVTGSGNVEGLRTTSGTQTFTGNTIGALSSTGAGTVTGIIVTGATTVTFSGNKIYDLSGNNAATITTGINVTAATTVNINNNIIGDLRATAATSTNAIVGLNLSATATYNVYYNTIYLNATSSSTTTFGSSCILFSSTATTLNHSDNLLVNLSTPAQEGLNVAANGISACLRRSGGTGGTVPSNYNTASNNNAYWCNPTAGTNNHMTYVEGTATITNPCNTVADMKTFMANRDQVSVPSNPTFLSTTGSNSNFLHIDTSVATPLESGGVVISGITTDFDGNTRNATTPDIGADEFAGIAADLTPPTITYTALGLTCSTGNRTLTGVTISDATKVDTTATFRPRIYYRKNAGSYFSQQGTLTAGNPSSGTWSFTIVAADMGGLAVSDVVSYFVIAQDSLTVPNVTSNPSAGLVATNVNSVSTAPTSPNSYTISTTLSGTYTVGAAGTYTTLDAAFTAYNSSCLGGAVVFSLIDNTYAVPTVALNANADASATNTLTIKPTLANTTISGSSTTAVIKLNGADYVIIDGSINTGTNSPCSPVVSLSRDLTISNTSTAAATAAIWLSSNGTGAGATNNVIKNCNIAAGVDPTTSSNASFGIVVSGATLGIVEGADNNNNNFENNSITKARYGIYVRSTGTTGAANDALFNTGNTIRQNLVGPTAFGSNEIGVAGIVLQGQANANVSYNEVRFVGVLLAQSASGNDRAGISFLDVKNSMMSHNLVHDIVDEKTYSSFGLSFGASNTYTTTNNIDNNIVYNVRSNGTLGDQALGLAIGPGSGDRVVYNTIAMSGDMDPTGATTASQSACGVRIDPLVLAITNLEFKNNIITVDVTSNTTSLKHYALVRPSAGFSWGTGGSNYNLLYRNASNTQTATGGTGTTVPYTEHTTLSDWQTATSQDANSSGLQPFFVSATDLHIDVTNTSNATLDNLGTPISGISTDYDCATRNATTPDFGADEFSIPACSGTPTPGSAIATPAGPFCGSGSSVLSLTGIPGVTGLTYQWQSSVTGTIGSYSNISGATSNTYSDSNISTTTWYQCVVTCTNSALSDTSTAVQIVVNPNPTVAVSPTSGLICGTGSVALSASGASTYTWSPTVGLSPTTGANVTSSVGATTTYTVTGTDVNGCTGTAQSTVVFSPAVPAFTATATPNPPCSSDGLVLGTTVGTSSAVVYNETFDGASNWTALNTSTGGTPADAAWIQRSSGYVYSSTTFTTGDASPFMLSNSDDQGSGTTATSITSPAIDLTDLSTANIVLNHYFRYNSGETAKVQVSTDGSLFTDVQTFTSNQGTSTSFTNTTININAYAGQATVYIRLQYDATWDWYWAVNNVAVSGNLIYNYAWSSTPTGFTSTLASPAAEPAVPTLYSVTITNSLGCTGNASVNVASIVQAADVDAGPATASTCVNTAISFTGTQNNTSGVLWTHNGNGTLTNATTLTPTYTPGALDAGTTVTITLTGTANSPCTNATDVISLSVLALGVFYTDADGDGFGDVWAPVAACSAGPGIVADATDCNDSDAALNPNTNWYADLDGDGYGSFIFLTSCNDPSLAGVVINGGDCDDTDNTIFPGAAELCQNGIDDDCDGIVDEGCSGIANDNWADAIAVTGSLSAYPVCTALNDTLLNADISPEGNPANVAVGGGGDVWYKFTSPSTGVQIKVVPTGFNAVIELQTSLGVEVDAENVNTAVGGTEILNRSGLTEGAQYWVGVRNYDNTAGGAFTICISPLLDSRCDEGPGTYAMCSNFKADYSGATNYTFHFTPTGVTPGSPSSGVHPSQIPLNVPLDLRYGGTYDVYVDANFPNLVNGIGGADPIVIVGTDVCPITIAAQPDVQVRESQRCPATVFRTTRLNAKPFICGPIVNFEYRFTEISCSTMIPFGVPFVKSTPTSSPNLLLNFNSPSLVPGSCYNVEVRPIFTYGPGSWGTPRCINIGSPLSMEMDLTELLNGTGEDSGEMELGIYPNPNNGDMVNLQIDGVESEDLFVRVTDGMGRVIYNERFVVEGSLNTAMHFVSPLSNGLYLVEIVCDGKITTRKMLVTK